jgi:hypothetical protein
VERIGTVGDLMAALERYDPDTPVLVAHQPGWPLQEVVAGVVEHRDGEDCGIDSCFAAKGDCRCADCVVCGLQADCGLECCDPERECDCADCVQCGADPVECVETTVYLIADGHPDDSPYAPRAVFEVL